MSKSTVFSVIGIIAVALAFTLASISNFGDGNFFLGMIIAILMVGGFLVIINGWVMTSATSTSYYEALQKEPVIIIASVAVMLGFALLFTGIGEPFRFVEVFIGFLLIGGGTAVFNIEAARLYKKVA